jgi:hypothetical protein
VAATRDPFIDRSRGQHEEAARILGVEPAEPPAQETNVGERIDPRGDVRQERSIGVDSPLDGVVDDWTPVVEGPEPKDPHRRVERDRARLVEPDAEDPRSIRTNVSVNDRHEPESDSMSRRPADVSAFMIRSPAPQTERRITV